MATQSVQGGELIAYGRGGDCTLSSDWFISSGSFELTH